MDGTVMNRENNRADFRIKAFFADQVVLICTFWVTFFLTPAFDNQGVILWYVSLMSAFCVVFFLFMMLFQMYNATTFLYIDRVIKNTTMSITGSAAIIFLFLFFSSIEKILIGYSLACFISYIIDSITVQKKTSYKVSQQAKDIFPYLAISLMIYPIAKGVEWLNIGLYLTVFIQLITITVFYIGALKLLGSRILEDVLSLFKNKKIR